MWMFSYNFLHTHSPPQNRGCPCDWLWVLCVGSSLSWLPLLCSRKGEGAMGNICYSVNPRKEKKGVASCMCFSPSPLVGLGLRAPL